MIVLLVIHQDHPELDMLDHSEVRHILRIYVVIEF